MIKKEKSGYKVLSEKGKNLGGPYRSKAAAQKRLRQVEYFKHKKGQSASGVDASRSAEPPRSLKTQSASDFSAEATAQRCFRRRVAR